MNREDYIYVYRAKWFDDNVHYLYQVGYYRPSGHWENESEWWSQDKAIQRMHFLNLGK